MRTFPTFRLAVLAILVLATEVPALADSESRCHKDKLNALAQSVKGSFSCKKKDLAATTLSGFDAACLGELSSTFPGKWAKAIAGADKQGVSCFGVPSMESAAASLVGAAADASAAIRAGLGAVADDDPNALRLLNTLMKATETYMKKTLAAQAKHAGKPDDAKLATALGKALSKYQKAFDKQTKKIAKPGITFMADASAVATGVDTIVEGLAAGVTLNPSFPVAYFVDSGVEGAQYGPGLDAVNNVTLAGGLFPVTDPVMRFSIGGITLGTATVPNTGRVTPVTLVPGAQDETHRTVTNMARFIQTLDDDGVAKNGISIPRAVRSAVENETLDFTDTNAVVALAESLTPLTAKGPRAAVSALQAQDHLNSSLLAGFAGDYAGTFNGTDFGTWQVGITSGGKIKGGGFSNDDGKFGVKGKVDSGGAATVAAGKTSTGASFSGTIDANGNFSGTWVNGPDSGTFTGGLVDD